MAQFLLQNLEFSLAALIALWLFALPKSQRKNSEEVPINIFDDLAISGLNLCPQRYLNFLERMLAYGGSSSKQSLARFASLKIYPSLAVTLLCLLFQPFIGIGIALGWFFLLDLFVFMKARKRQNEIASALPQAIDIMLLGVDAGLSLDATLQRIASDQSSVSNALNNELAKLGRDILLGVDRESAFADLFQRTGVEELKSFGSALNQSSKLGLSIGRVLRAQSQFIRMRQRQKAEEKAARLPIWMAFPLWLCIMPSLLLILLGPSLLLFFERIFSIR